MTAGDQVTRSVWEIVPSLLWFGLAAAALYFLRRELKQVVSELAFRLRSGVAVKIASVEVGAVLVAPGANVSEEEHQRGVRQDADRRRSSERRQVRHAARDVMLVHRLYKSRQDGQLYDIVVYLVPHKEASLAGVTRVEYFFGRFWGDKVFPSTDRSRGFPLATCAYGPTLCTAEVYFNDGGSVILHRYLDFEMGAYAPAKEAKSPKS